ncbi:MAG: alpha/beta hydrolase [Candidatus Buchananbacteria bacterium]
MREKLFIRNRKKKNLSIIVEKHKKQNGLVFIMHGLGGFKEQGHLQIVADAFRQKNFTVVRFDVANSVGEGEGCLENARATNYYQDLEDVIAWSKIQSWYQEPFALAGHSLGGICISMYAQKNPKKVSLLAPISTVVSGKLVYESHKKYDFDDPNVCRKISWLKGLKTTDTKKIKKLAQAFIRDCMKYNLLKEVSKLTMPVLLVAGDRDGTIPRDHIEILYQALPEPKELCIIKNAPHTFRSKKHLRELKKIFLGWIEKYA